MCGILRDPSGLSCVKSFHHVDMAWKTRKQRGRGLANFFKKKKAPLSSQGNTSSSNSVQMTQSSNVVNFKRKMTEGNFITMKQKKTALAKMIRSHVQRMKNVSPEVRNDALKLMNNDMRNKTRKLLNYPSYNSLSNDQIIELFQTGKIRSSSY